MTIADIIFGILIAAPIIVSIITLSEMLTFKRIVLESIDIQSRALAAIMETLIHIHRDTATANTIVMGERE